jgi:hypothetical protein
LYRSVNGWLVGHEETVVTIDSTLDDGFFKNVVWMGSVFLHHHDEHFGHVNVHETVSVFFEKHPKFLELVGRNFEPILMIVVVPFESIEYLLIIKEVLEEVNVVNDKDVDSFVSRSAEFRHLTIS